MAPSRSKTRSKTKKIRAITHSRDKRLNIPSAELENLVKHEAARPVIVEYPREADLDPQLLWSGKDAENNEPLAIDSVPIYIQEKIHPKAIIRDLKSQSEDSNTQQPELFYEDWANELPLTERIDFYAHSQKWANRFILGDSLQVMTSLGERENLKGRVQCFYFDPPYGINFSSNWQPNTAPPSKAQTDAAMSREPEVVRAFRDTWKNGIHSYLSYIRDRMLVARNLLTESGSIFLQIGNENVHLLRVLMDEVFGPTNFVAQIVFVSSGALGAKKLPIVNNYIVWYAKNKEEHKYRQLYDPKESGGKSSYNMLRNKNLQSRAMSSDEKNDSSKIPDDACPYTKSDLLSSGRTESCLYDFTFQDKLYKRRQRSWKTNKQGMQRLMKADRILPGRSVPSYRNYFDDKPAQDITNHWGAMRSNNPIYVVQTPDEIVKRCILMSTDPGDLIFDPTCGSGTTAYVAEAWGRRWITTDTSRIALALARTRMMNARFNYYKIKRGIESAPPPRRKMPCLAKHYRTMPINV